jgi:hypothetical protein
MVEITFENMAPIAALLIVAVTIWGAARKFTSLEITQANNQKSNETSDALNAKDVQRNIDDLKELKEQIKELYVKLLKLEQKVEDKLKE